MHKKKKFEKNPGLIQDKVKLLTGEIWRLVIPSFIHSYEPHRVRIEVDEIGQPHSIINDSGIWRK